MGSQTTRLHNFWRDWRGVILMIVLMVFLRSTIADWYQVPTGSMKPTIVEGDRIFVNKLAYGVRFPFTSLSLMHWAEPHRGDIVVFDSPADDQRLVKRVIGLPGDTVALRGNRVIINGRVARYRIADQSPVAHLWDSQRMPHVLLDEFLPGREHEVAWIAANGLGRRNFGPVTVPKDRYFVLGDNRDNSADSRVIGFVPRDNIIGRAGSVVMSLDPNHYYLPRPDRFFHDLP
jgi:signal peptidase I